MRINRDDNGRQLSIGETVLIAILCILVAAVIVFTPIAIISDKKHASEQPAIGDEITIERNYTIVDKHIDIEVLNNGNKVWRFYYLTLEKYGDIEVDKDEYEKYEIGDTYSFTTYITITGDN